MNREQKRILAGILIRHVGNLVEFWSDDSSGAEELINQGINAGEAAEVIAQWLSKLPGDEWDTRLPEPK